MDYGSIIDGHRELTRHVRVSRFSHVCMYDPILVVLWARIKLNK